MAAFAQVQLVGAGLLGAFNTLNGIASDKGHEIKSLTIDTNKSNVANGIIVGNFTVRNRSRRAFKLAVTRSGCGGSQANVEVTALGVTRRVAA